MKLLFRVSTIVLLFLLSTLYFLLSPPVLAAAPSSQGLGCGGSLGPLGDVLCNITSSDTAVVGNQFNKVMSAFIGFMTIVAALWFGLQIIITGYQWIGAGGDKTKTEEARNKLTNLIIGLIIVVAAWVIIGLIGRILGLDILNPGAIIQTLGQ